jgi:F-type H+-transporting ATPase subunit c
MLKRAGLTALVVVETSVILAGISALLLIMMRDYCTAAQATSSAIALIIPACVAAWASMRPTREALYAIARQPFSGNKIITTLLIVLTVLQTPVILGFITALSMLMRIPNNCAQSLSYIAGGIAVGAGSIGPLIGLGIFGAALCRALGRNPGAHAPLVPFLFIGQALIETPALLALIIALALIVLPTRTDTVFEGIVRIIAGITTAGVTFGPGIASGKTAAAAAREIGKIPKRSRPLMQLSLITQTLIDTGALYGIVAALIMIIIGL